MTTTAAKSNGKPRRSSRRHEPVDRTQQVPLIKIQPSPENDQLYRPIDPDDPEIQALADSIRENGVLEPLVLTRDGFILSGHRRHVAAELAGLKTVPCRYEQFSRSDENGQFIARLREYNRQREKSFAEKLREEIVSADPDEAYVAPIEHRENASRVDVPPMVVRKRRRPAISDVKMAMLDAVLAVIEEMEEYLPISERVIHYNLLRELLLRNTKTGLKYLNDKRSSKDLSDLVTRARSDGTISWDDICDETRPVQTWNVHSNVRTFLQESVAGFLKGYWRDLMVSQPNHFEILVEKNTVMQIVNRVAAKYTIPVTSARGNSSKSPLWDIVKRFNASGKEKLVLLLLSDFDSDGISITDSIVGYMLHDFAAYGITEEVLHPVRMGLWKHQVEEMDNPPTSLEPNLKSSNYTRFVEEHGTDCWEIEAITTEHLQRIVADAIDSMIDVDAFNAEIDADRADAIQLQATRNQLQQMLLGAI